jgi:glycerol uptake facilitator-like aquaporin
MLGRKKVAAVGAEFLGTAILTFVVQVLSHSQLGLAYFIAFAAGLVVLVSCVGLGRVLQLNPAYTLALWTARQIRTTKAAAFILVQLAGAYAAGWLYYWFAGGNFRHVPHNFDSHVLVAEAAGTFVFALAAAGAMYQKQHWSVRSLALGAGYTLGIFVASVGSLAYINPAVALGASAWVWGTYVLGPVLGAIIAVNLYGLLFAPASALVGKSASRNATASSSASKKTSTASKTTKAKAKK